MKTKFVLASFVAALSGLAALATSANAAPDIQVRVNVALPPPPVVFVGDRDHGDRDYDRSYNRHRENRNHRSSRGDDWYDQQRDKRRALNGHSEARGYWKDVVVKRWVPARWEIGYDRHGREVQIHRPGYMAHHTERVWVSR